MNTKKNSLSYRTMAVLAVVVGVVSMILQFFPDLGIMAFMLSTVVPGGLIGMEPRSEERDRQQLGQNYKKIIEWLFLFFVCAYALVVVSQWLGIMAGTVTFLNNHWPGLILAVMCTFIGIAGLQMK